MLLIGGVTPALGQVPGTEAVEQGATPMDQSNMANPQPEQNIFPAPAKSDNPFIDDSKFSAQLRSFYFNRDKYDNSRSEAWALGGWAGFQSGYLANRFRVGAVAYTSQPLYAPDDRDGTLLLARRHDGEALGRRQRARGRTRLPEATRAQGHARAHCRPRGRR
jgi:hypothetical protein